MIYQLVIFGLLLFVCNAPEHVTCSSTDDVLTPASSPAPPKGQKGVPGKRGPVGAKGDNGSDGAKGDTGSDGAKGDTGSDGAKGDTGNDGAKGDTGSDGVKGDTGSDGAKGDKGDTGVPDNSRFNSLQGELSTLRQQVEALQRSNRGDLTSLRQQVEALNASNNELRRVAIGTVNGWYAPLDSLYHYKVTSFAQSWDESRVICQGWGGDLAVHGIQTLDSRLNLIRALSLTTRFWIGASDKGNEGTWKWVNGDDATNEQILWRYHQPDNAGNNEDCVEMVVLPDYNGRSNDLACSVQRQGLCEKTI